MRDQTPSQVTSRLVTIKNMVQMPRYKDAFSESSIRSLIFNSESRQSSKGAICRFGRRVLINLDAFDAWVEIRFNAQIQNIDEQLN